MTQKPEPDCPSSSGRTIGLLRGKLEVPEDSDAPLQAEVQVAFEGVAAGEASPAQQGGDESGVPTSPSKTTWNYRVISFTHGEDAWCAIHEVYYDDGVPTAYSSTPAVVMWDLEEGDGAGSRTVDRMREALGKPVLTEGDFRRER